MDCFWIAFKVRSYTRLMFKSTLNAVVGDKWQYDKYALDFNGTDEYLDTGSAFQDLVRGDDGFTVVMLVHNDDGRPSANSSYFGVKADDDNICDVLVNTQGKFMCQLISNGSGEYLHDTAVDFQDGNADGWMHLVFGSDSNSNAGFQVNRQVFNGQFTSPSTDANITPFQSDRQAFSNVIPFFIGARDNEGDADQFFNGKISEVIVFNHYLHGISEDYRNFWNNGIPYDPTKGGWKDYLVAWWRMGDGTEQGAGNIIYDMSGNGHNATMVGMDDSNYVYMEGNIDL